MSCKLLCRKKISTSIASWHGSCLIEGRMNDLLYRILSKCFLGALLALAMSMSVLTIRRLVLPPIK